MMKFSLDDDECAMDLMGMNGIKRSPEELEEVRGDEKEGDGQPIDFSHLMNEVLSFHFDIYLLMLMRMH